MNFETDITAPVGEHSDRDAAFAGESAQRRHCGVYDVASPVRLAPTLPASVTMHSAALILLPVCLPLMAMWTILSVLARATKRFRSESAVLYIDDGLPVSIEDYIFKPSDLYSGLRLAGHGSARPELNQISALVYLYRPKSFERSLQDLSRRPTIFFEFLARVRGGRVALMGLNVTPNGRIDALIAWLAVGLGADFVFALSSGLSPEPCVPD